METTCQHKCGMTFFCMTSRCGRHDTSHFLQESILFVAECQDTFASCCASCVRQHWLARCENTFFFSALVQECIASTRIGKSLRTGIASCRGAWRLPSVSDRQSGHGVDPSKTCLEPRCGTTDKKTNNDQICFSRDRAESRDLHFRSCGLAQENRAAVSQVFIGMRLSRYALGFFDNQFSKPGPLRAAHKTRSLLYVWAVFSCPTFLVLVGNHPGVQDWFIEQYRPIEYPPQSDPNIIYDIYSGKTPKRTSQESYDSEVRAFRARGAE